MTSVAQVAIHASQFPDKVRRDLLESLRTRRVNPKFHYQSAQQARKWLALHQAYSPSRADPSCLAAYAKSFEAAAARVGGPQVCVVGLGCGGGRKDTALLDLLRAPGRELFYTPVDVSVPLVLEARQTALAVVPESNCRPLVCDLALADDLPAVLDALDFGTCPGQVASQALAAARVFTFFGMLPNFEPDIILPQLAALMRPNDLLLFSANLAPGPEYGAGVRAILPLYDNALTRDWLLTFLLDLGVDAGDGSLRFCVEERAGLKCVAAWFDFTRPRVVAIETDQVEFRAGESLRLFFSYRHTPALARSLLARHGLETLAYWTDAAGQEGVFAAEALPP